MGLCLEAGGVRRTKNWQNILIIALIFAILSLDAVSAQTPCDNVAQYLEDNGIIEQPYDVRIIEGPIHIVNESFYVAKMVVNRTDKIFFVGCESGEIYDHKPSTEEILGAPVPENIHKGLFIRMKTAGADRQYTVNIITDRYLTRDIIDQLDSTVLELKGVVPYIHANVTLEQFDAISEFDWADVPSIRRNEFNNSDELLVEIHTKSGLPFTKERYEQLTQTGAEISSIIQNIEVVATPDQIESISGFEWVLNILEVSYHVGWKSDKTSGANFSYYAFIFLFLAVAFLIVRKIKWRKSGG